MKTLGDYELKTCLFSNEQYSEHQATDRNSGAEVRLIQFADSLCAHAGFRAEFRKDLPILHNLRHFHILAIIDWGESNGQLFYTTEPPEGERLSSALLHQLDWDQLADLAWQLTSGIQHAHNIGLSHGGLSMNCVFVSPQIRVQIGGFGLQHWIDAGNGKVTDEVTRHAADAQQVAVVVRDLIELNQHADCAEFEPLRQIIDAVLTDSAELTARDIQRRLGKLLLRDTGDSIEMIDERAGQSLGRRSLVDELFDDLPQPVLVNPAPSTAKPPSLAFEIACIIALLLLLAYGIWSAVN